MEVFNLQRLRATKRVVRCLAVLRDPRYPDDLDFNPRAMSCGGCKDRDVCIKIQKIARRED